MKKLIALTITMIISLISGNLTALCNPLKLAKYSENKKLPYLEIWNKEKPGITGPSEAVSIAVNQNIAKIRDTQTFLIQPGFRLFGWTAPKVDRIRALGSGPEKDIASLQDSIDATKPVYIAVYKNTPKWHLDYDSVKVYKVNPNTTVYLTWTKNRGLNPETSILGSRGSTESCLGLGQNVKTLTDVTKQVPAAAVAKVIAPTASEKKAPIGQKQESAAAKLAREAIEKKAKQQKQLESELEKTRAALAKKQAAAKKAAEDAQKKKAKPIR